MVHSNNVFYTARDELLNKTKQGNSRNTLGWCSFIKIKDAAQWTADDGEVKGPSRISRAAGEDFQSAVRRVQEGISPFTVHILKINVSITTMEPYILYHRV